MRLLTNVDVERLLTPADALGAVRAAFTELESGTAAIQARERTQVGDVKLTTLGAVLAGDGVLGAKVYSTVAGRFTFLVVLFAADDGRRLAVLESDALTRLRTAAASVLAAQLLARAAAKRLVVFGSGVPAQGHVSAFSDAFELETITVVSRSAGSPPLAWGHDGQPLTVTNDASTALAGADLVVTATRSMTPLFPCALLPDGTHVSAVGTSRPEARELDSEIYPRAAAVVVEWLPQARREAGGLIQAIEAGSFGWNRVVELVDVLAGRVAGRQSPDDVTVFQSVGIGLEDVALAALAWRRSEADGGGLIVGAR